jgi:DivIVA domain-containing protein
MVLLTPKDIRERYIPVVRFKEGFDKDAVDDFLDEVAETVEVLGRQAMQNDASTQSLGPDVAKLNSKISELTAQVESLQKENATLKSAPNKSDGPAEGTAKLAEAEQRVQTLATQNEQLKQQVDQLNNQIDQLTAQAAKGNDAEALANQLTAVQQERDSFRSRGEGLQQQLSAAQQQVVQLQQQLSQQSGASQNLSKQLDESKQREEQLRQQVSKMEPSTETGSLKKIAGAGADANSEPERATAMLTLAMQLHDQYVDKGKAKGAELIADGQSKHDASVAKADEYSNRRMLPLTSTPSARIQMLTTTQHKCALKLMRIQLRPVVTLISTASTHVQKLIPTSPKFRSALSSTTRKPVLGPTNMLPVLRTSLLRSLRSSRAIFRVLSSSNLSTGAGLPSSSASWSPKFLIPTHIRLLKGPMTQSTDSRPARS